MNKKLEGYIFVKDAFGDFPVWSLQHPIKENEDGYMIHPKDIIKKRPTWLKNILTLENFVNKISNKLLSPNDIVDVRVWGEIEFHQEEDERYIDKLNIKNWSIEGTKCSG